MPPLNIRSHHWVAIFGSVWIFISTICGAAAAYVKATATDGMTTITQYMNPWKVWITIESGGSSHSISRSISDMDANDEPFCSNGEGPTNSTQKSRLQFAEAMTVIACLFAFAYIITTFLRAMNRLPQKRSRDINLMNGLAVLGPIVACIGAWTSYYSACDKTLCESWEDNYSDSSCGADAGLVLMWLAIPTTVVCLILMARFEPQPTNAAGGPNAQPFMAQPQTQVIGAVVTDQQGYQGAYPGMQQPPPAQSGYPGAQPQSGYPGATEQVGYQQPAYGYPGADAQPTQTYGYPGQQPAAGDAYGGGGGGIAEEPTCRA